MHLRHMHRLHTHRLHTLHLAPPVPAQLHREAILGEAFPIRQSPVVPASGAGPPTAQAAQAVAIGTVLCLEERRHQVHRS